jgi:hypothetical protein
MTSDDLMTAVTFEPAFKPSSSTASFVIEAVTVNPFTSMRTCEVVAPFLTSLTVPSRGVARGYLHVLTSSWKF